jgi:hypothetical protein
MPGTPLLGFGFVVIAAALIVMAIGGVHQGSRACGDPPAMTSRLVRRFALVLALWVAAILIAAGAGVLTRWHATPPPILLLLAGILILGFAIAQSAAGDRLARGLPLAALVGYQAFRLPLELLMHRAANDGVMPMQMSYSGRNFDIITGITAAILGVLLWFRPLPRTVIAAWNLLGLALLFNIAGVALLSTPRFQYFGADRLNTFVAYPPYVLLPGVMVLAAWAGHLIVFRALRSGSRNREPQDGKSKSRGKRSG